jgi:uncharacterized protein (TIGR02246 family)
VESHPPKTSDFNSDDESAIRRLYQEMLDRWNKRNAGELAALFEQAGNIVGFDGSPHNGRTEIESNLRQIFSDHPTAAYVGKVRDVRFLGPEVAILRAIAGMVPPGKSDLNPAVNAVQTLVAAKHQGQWRIALFQNTPAAFHGQPELSQQLTEELREVLRSR